MGGHEGLLDELACVQVINRYATAVDGVDIDLLRSCFFDDVEAAYMGRAIAPGVQPIVDMISPLARMRGTVHNLGPVHATASRGSAHATAGCLVLAVSDGDAPRGVLRGVKYEFELASREGEWRITRLRHDVLWATAAPQSGPTGEPLSD
jgi:SnoaL-like domain